jgi:hypothetical protein
VSLSLVLVSCVGGDASDFCQLSYSRCGGDVLRCSVSAAHYFGIIYGVLLQRNRSSFGVVGVSVCVSGGVIRCWRVVFSAVSSGVYFSGGGMRSYDQVPVSCRMLIAIYFWYHLWYYCDLIRCNSVR